MKTIKLGIIGFGNVGEGLVSALHSENDYLKKEMGAEILITAITDRGEGCIYDPDGLPLNELANKKPFSEIAAAEHPNWNAIEMIQNADTNVIVELSHTNLETGEPALTYVKEAILSGKHVITSNKGPIALYYKSLKTLARENNVSLGIEGTVMSGSPAIHLAVNALIPAKITAVKGILNGTTNYILSKMEEGTDYESALEQAQALGYAEADPSGDVEGFDAAGKVAILAQLLFGSGIKPSEVDRTGITDITVEDINAAKKENCRWKLIGSVEKTEDGVKASVKPMMLPHSNPLAGVMGVTNAIQYQTELLGEVTLIGPGAGRKETACAILEDLLDVIRKYA